MTLDLPPPDKAAEEIFFNQPVPAATAPLNPASFVSTSLNFNSLVQPTIPAPPFDDAEFVAIWQEQQESGEDPVSTHFGFTNGIRTSQAYFAEQCDAANKIYCEGREITNQYNDREANIAVEIWNSANGLASSRRGQSVEPVVEKIADSIEKTLASTNDRWIEIGYSQGSINVLNALEHLQRKHGPNYFSGANAGRVKVIFFGSGLEYVPKGVEGVVYKYEDDYVANSMTALHRTAIGAKKLWYGKKRPYQELKVVELEGDAHGFETHLNNLPKFLIERFSTNGSLSARRLSDHIFQDQFLTPEVRANVISLALDNESNRHVAWYLRLSLKDYTREQRIELGVSDALWGRISSSVE